MLSFLSDRFFFFLVDSLDTELDLQRTVIILLHYHDFSIKVVGGKDALSYLHNNFLFINLSGFLYIISNVIKEVKCQSYICPFRRY